MQRGSEHRVLQAAESHPCAISMELPEQLCPSRKVALVIAWRMDLMRPDRRPFAMIHGRSGGEMCVG